MFFIQYNTGKRLVLPKSTMHKFGLSMTNLIDFLTLTFNLCPSSVYEVAARDYAMYPYTYCEHRKTQLRKQIFQNNNTGRRKKTNTNPFGSSLYR